MKMSIREAINQTLRELRKERKLLEEIRKQDKGPPLPQDTDGVDENADDDGQTGQRPDLEVKELTADALIERTEK